ncbi:MAG: helix-turn-helix transcriptional regulator [Proteobacteria bacterium]|nr:helix-turn-helix transcriptional regulator [Pseudomonadota bacterium]
MPQSTHHQHYQAFLGLLRSLRETCGLTQVALADRIGNTQTFVSKVERGERRLDVVEFAEWCEALGYSPESAFEEFLAKRKARSTRSRKLAATSGRAKQ